MLAVINMRIFALLLIFPLFGNSQTMQSIVRQLPIECLPDLNIKQRDVLLKKSFLELPDGDSLERVQYELDTPVLKNYISFGLSFPTGQAGFTNFELKRFKTISGSSLIIFSKYGGARSLYSQDTLKIFMLNNGKLMENKGQNLLPQSISFNDFLKKQTPDSIRKKIESYSNSCYYLNREKSKEIEFNLSTPFMSEELEKWLLGDTFIFTWNGKSFKRKLVFGN